MPSGSLAVRAASALCRSRDAPSPAGQPVRQADGDKPDGFCVLPEERGEAAPCRVITPCPPEAAPGSGARQERGPAGAGQGPAGRLPAALGEYGPPGPGSSVCGRSRGAQPCRIPPSRPSVPSARPSPQPLSCLCAPRAVSPRIRAPPAPAPLSAAGLSRLPWALLAVAPLAWPSVTPGGGCRWPVVPACPALRAAGSPSAFPRHPRLAGAAASGARRSHNMEYLGLLEKWLSDWDRVFFFS